MFLLSPLRHSLGPVWSLAPDRNPPLRFSLTLYAAALLILVGVGSHTSSTSVGLSGADASRAGGGGSTTSERAARAVSDCITLSAASDRAPSHSVAPLNTTQQ